MGPHAPSCYPAVGGFQRWSNFCPKASPIIIFAASSAKECHNLIMFSVKVLFPLFLLNTQVLNNLRSLPDLPLLSYLVFSVSSQGCALSYPPGSVLLALTAWVQRPSGHLCQLWQCCIDLYQQSNCPVTSAVMADAWLCLCLCSCTKVL